MSIIKLAWQKEKEKREKLTADLGVDSKVVVDVDSNLTGSQIDSDNSLDRSATGTTAL